MVLKEVKKECIPLLHSSSQTAQKKVIIYSNMRDKTIDMAKRFEQFLNTDNNLYLTDAISIHGQLAHEEKELFLKLFMGDKNPIQEADIWILLVTSGVTNAGIDCSKTYSTTEQGAHENHGEGQLKEEGEWKCLSSVRYHHKYTSEYEIKINFTMPEFY